MELFVFKEALCHLMAELKFVLMVHGVLSAVIFGITVMLVLCAGS